MGKKYFQAAFLTGVVFLAAFLSGCFDDTATGPKQDTEIRFPLAVGNTWMYRCTFELMTITPDDTTRETARGDATWTITAIEKVFGVDAYRMEITQHVISGSDSGKTFTFNNWYAERDSVLLAVANEDTAIHTPFLMAQLFKSSTPRSGISDWGATVLVYPLAVGREWRFIPYDEINKIVEARETINVQGRSFDTFRIARNFDTSSGPEAQTHWEVLSWTQWFSLTGLVKNRLSSITFREGVTNHETNTLELISYSLK